MRAHICMCICMLMYTHIRMHQCAHAYSHAQSHTCKLIHTFTPTHSHPHTLSYTHTLARTPTSVTTLTHAAVGALVQTGLSPPECAAPAGKEPSPATHLPDVPPEEHSTRGLPSHGTTCTTNRPLRVAAWPWRNRRPLALQDGGQQGPRDAQPRRVHLAKEGRAHPLPAGGPTHSPHGGPQPGRPPLPTASSRTGNSSPAHRGPETPPSATSELFPPSEKQASPRGRGCLIVRTGWSPTAPTAGGRPRRSPGTPLSSMSPSLSSTRLTQAPGPVSLQKGPRGRPHVH